MEKKTKNTTRKATAKEKKEIQSTFVALLDSCVEGCTGEWDATGEGAEVFMDMHELLMRLADHYNVDDSGRKYLENASCQEFI